MTGRNQLDAVLFDLDGTLAQSLPVMKTVYSTFAYKHHFIPTEEEFSLLNGPSLSEIIAYLKKTHQLVKSNHALLDDYTDLIKQEYFTKVKPAKGATSLLKTLRSLKIQAVLVTSSPKEVAQTFLQRQQWEPLFIGSVFGNDVKRAKPCGDIYRLALNRFSLSPERVLVLEDSVNGIRSAHDAGIRVIGVGENAASLLAAGASRVISSLDQFLEFL